MATRSSRGGAERRELFIAEPAAQYLVRPPVVVDCSLLCAVLFDEPEGPDALAQLRGHRLCAPSLLDQEVLNVAVIKQRRGLPAEVARRALADYEELPVELAEPVLSEQLALAVQYGLTGYDAAYLWLAAEMRAPLLTFDRKLAEAARAHLKTLG